jgi:hypothetical protein
MPDSPSHPDRDGPFARRPTPALPAGVARGRTVGPRRHGAAIGPRTGLPRHAGPTRRCCPPAGRAPRHRPPRTKDRGLPGHCGPGARRTARWGPGPARVLGEWRRRPPAPVRRPTQRARPPGRLHSAAVPPPSSRRSSSARRCTARRSKR